MADTQTPGPRESVGHMLKALREAQNLTLADIAGRLHLDPRVIAAIETGDQGALPVALYVRGYLRGYARILGADPEQVVDLYNEQSPSTPPEIIPEISQPHQSTSEDTPVRLTTAAVAIVLAGLLGVWWETTYRGGSSVESKAKLPPSTPALELKPRVQAPLSQLDYTYTVVTHPDSAYFQGADGIVAPLRTPAPAASPVGTDRILFRATTDSWLEVTDRTGERIYMDFLRGGESLTLTGEAPFGVLLGYAPGVSVEYNGRTVDTTADTRAGVARFSLGR
jgi:cytoskeleton protein RodZ